MVFQGIGTSPSAINESQTYLIASKASLNARLRSSRSCSILASTVASTARSCTNLASTVASMLGVGPDGSLAQATTHSTNAIPVTSGPVLSSLNYSSRCTGC